MTASASYIIRRNDQTTIYEDPWGQLFLHSDLIWGPQALLRWLSDEPLTVVEEASAPCGVYVDFDERTLDWFTEPEFLQIPRASQTFQRMLGFAWSGFQVTHQADGMASLIIRSNANSSLGNPATPPSVRFQDVVLRDSNANLGTSNQHELSPDRFCAWLSVQKPSGEFKHWLLACLPDDVLEADETNRDLDSAIDWTSETIPDEINVCEGMVIDHASQKIHLWGNQLLEQKLPLVRLTYRDFEVLWLKESGYETHCEITKSQGHLWQESDVEKFLIEALSQPREVDFEEAFRDLKHRIRRIAYKGAILLLLIVVIPLLLVGGWKGDWQANLFTLVCVVLAYVFGFKFLEYRLTRTLRQEFATSSDASKVQTPSVGPSELDARRIKLSEIAASCRPKNDPSN